MANFLDEIPEEHIALIAVQDTTGMIFEQTGLKMELIGLSIGMELKFYLSVNLVV